METKKRPQNAGSSAAFTLIEVMIASGILSVEILAVMAMLAIATKTNIFASRLTSANGLAQSKIEESKNIDYDNLADATDCFKGDLSAESCGGNPIFTRVTDVTKDSPITGVTTVDVRVQWRDLGGNTHEARVVSAVSSY